MLSILKQRELGKDTHINLVRINTQAGWNLANVKLMVRDKAMRRVRPKDAKGNPIKRRRRNEQ